MDVSLDGSQFKDIDTYLLGALALSAATGRSFEMHDVGKVTGKAGVSPAHLTATRALATLCGADIKGDAVGAKGLRFIPSHKPVAKDLVLDTGEVTGRPSPTPITPIVEALIPALALAPGASLIRARGANATPGQPSAFWLRETLAQMLNFVGIEIAVEVEKWGWHPDGGGEITFVLEGGWEPTMPRGRLAWEERGDPVWLSGIIALSPRMNEQIGLQMQRSLQRALEREPLERVAVEIQRVRSPGPGAGLFLTLQLENTVAGFEAISHSGMAADQVVEEVTGSLSQYLWSDAAFDPEVARALMIPLALTGQPAFLTTSALTLPMRILEFLIPRFLPVRVELEKHPTGGAIRVQPAGSPPGNDEG